MSVRVLSTRPGQAPRTYTLSIDFAGETVETGAVVQEEEETTTVAFESKHFQHVLFKHVGVTQSLVDYIVRFDHGYRIDLPFELFDRSLPSTFSFLTNRDNWSVGRWGVTRKSRGSVQMGTGYVIVIRDERGHEETLYRRSRGAQPGIGWLIDLPDGEFIVERAVMRDDPAMRSGSEQQMEDVFQIPFFYVSKASGGDESESPRGGGASRGGGAKVLPHPRSTGTRASEPDFSSIESAVIFPVELALVLVAISYRLRTDEYEELRTEAGTLIRVDVDHCVDSTLDVQLLRHSRQSKRLYAELVMRMAAFRDANAQTTSERRAAI